jgi:putative PIN family toxin of toxin-antitoxin system
VYICDELEKEFVRTASHEKIRKYATDERITQTLDLMKASCILCPIGNRVVSSDLRDVNDLYLLALAEVAQADFILTGDKDLLSLQYHHQTRITTYKEFATMC